MKQKTEIQRSFSAYCFSMVITVVICTFIMGIVYIDCCAKDTILSANGVIYPLFEKIISIAENSLRI